MAELVKRDYPRDPEGTASVSMPPQIRPSEAAEAAGGPTKKPQSSSDPSLVTFPQTNFGADGAARVWLADVLKDFEWVVSDDISVRRVIWEGMKKDAPGPFREIAIVENGQQLEKRRALEIQPESKKLFTVTENGLQWKAVLNLTHLTTPDYSTYLKHDMRMKIEWVVDGDPGFTTSGLFAATKDAADGQDWLSSREGALQEKAKEIGQEIMNPNPALQTAESQPSSTSAKPLATEEPADVPPPVSSDTAAPSNQLSTGVIAGIAVGGAVAVILLITLIFCLYRRSHRKRQAAEKAAAAGDESQQDQPTVYFADKAANSNGPDTPMTSYSEDGGARDLQMAAAGGVASRGQQPHDHLRQEQQAHHLRPISDGNWPLKSPEPSVRAEPTARSGTATPLGVSRNIVHLVEDGMTDDEIRRLEEEERQIEAAIAARRR